MNSAQKRFSLNRGASRSHCLSVRFMQTKQPKPTVRFLTLGFAVLAALWLLPIAQATAQPATHVIVISVDGLGGTYLSNLLARTDNVYPIPNFKRFKNEGAGTLAAHIDNNNYETLPNHVSIVTARPQLGVNGHGWTSNGDPAVGQTIHSVKGAYVAGVFDVAHDNGLRTGMYANKTKFSLFDTNASYPGGGSYNAIYGARDTTGVDNGRDKIDNTYITATLGGPIVNNFIAQQTTNPMQYAFLHLNEPDSAGHASGWGSAAWYSSVVAVDTMLGKLFKLVEQDLPALIGHTAIILTADHGYQGAPGPNTYSVPFFVWGPGVSAGADLYALNAGQRKVATTYPLTTYSGLQPIRNAEANNLALQLLGLGPIPGSTFNYAQDLRATLPPTPLLTGIAADGLGNFNIGGTANRSGKVVLWKATRLTPPNWLSVATNAVSAGVPFDFIVPQGADPAAFFRMQGQ